MAKSRNAVKSGTKASMPLTVDPMLCTLVREPFTGPEWLFEVKWDGYRLISYVKGNKIRLASRGGLNYTAKYPPLEKAFKALGHDVILDGEAVVFDKDGKPDFDALQKFNGHNAPIAYCAFDLLWLDGYSLMDLPLSDRKARLQSLLKNNKVIRYSDHYEDGVALYDKMKDLDLEGIVGKKRDSIYQPGVRGYDWVKVPTRKRQEFVIGGWAESDKSRSFRSLLFGAYNGDGKLEWIGRSGGGFKEKEMPAILKELQKREVAASPFTNKVLDTKGAVIHYVKPELVANFEFATWTESGRIRKPATFLGMRKDKKARQVVREKAVTAAKVESEQPAPKPTKHKYLNASSNWKKIDAIKVQNAGELTVGKCRLEVTDLDRQIWKGVNKADLIQYYHQVSRFMLPHLKNRPQSLHIKPINAGADGFYIKDMEKRQPECATVFTDQRKHRAEGKRSQIDYLVCNNENTLLWMVNLGCIDINPWSATITSPETPDFISIDLDPSDDDFKKAIETAQAAHSLLEKEKITSFVKTSGKTGIHIFLPCKGFDFPQVRAISENLADEIHRLVPRITTTEVSVNSRGNKLFIDPSQNDYADTLAAAYSARPWHHPTVSTPLHWREVKAGLDPYDFTIHTIAGRLSKTKDLWQALAGARIKMSNSSKLKKWL